MNKSETAKPDAEAYARTGRSEHRKAMRILMRNAWNRSDDCPGEIYDRELDAMIDAIEAAGFVRDPAHD